MSSENQGTELLNRYVESVGRFLPSKQRADIQMELHSTLQDILDDRAEGQEPSEALVVSVLQEFGTPEQVAVGYLPQKHLIGPRMYPVFSLTLKIILSIVVLQFLVAFVVSVGQGVSSFGDLLAGLGRSLLGLYSSAFETLGVIVAIFYVLERTLPAPNLDAQVKAWAGLAPLRWLYSGRAKGSNGASWNPRELAEIEKDDLVKFGETVFGLVFLLAFAVLFNLYPQWVGVGSYSDVTGLNFTPVLAATYTAYLWWVNAYWLLRAVLLVTLLSRGRWSNGLRWADRGIKVYGLLVIIFILVGPPLVGLNPAFVEFHGLSARALADATRFVIPVMENLVVWTLRINLIVHGALLIAKIVEVVSEGALPLPVFLRRK